MRKSFNRKKDDGLRKSKRKEEIESEKGSSQGFRKGRIIITSLLGRISHVRILDHAIDNKFYTRRSSQLFLITVCCFLLLTEKLRKKRNP